MFPSLCFMTLPFMTGDGDKLGAKGGGMFSRSKADLVMIVKIL